MSEMVTFPGLPTKAFYSVVCLSLSTHVCRERNGELGTGLPSHHPWGTHFLFAVEAATWASVTRKANTFLSKRSGSLISLVQSFVA